MSEEYLWDRRGEADADENALESHLAKYRFVKRPFAPLRPAWFGYALAATVVIGCFLSWRLWPVKKSDWMMNGVAVPMNRIVKLDQNAEVEVGRIGRVRFASGSRFRILRSDGEHEVMELLEGKFDAFIIADPYVFQVQTPPAKLDDLGCAYEVIVDGAGNGKVSVTSGWVRVNAQKQESLVRQGYEVDLVKGQAPSLPRRTMDSQEKDVLQLLHRLWREPLAESRGEAFDQLAVIYPPPAGVTRERALSGDPKIVSDYWPALNLGPAIKLPRVFYGE